VRCGDISIQVAYAKAATVLGNVITGQIVIPGGLQAPWEALCLRKTAPSIRIIHEFNPDKQRICASAASRSSARGAPRLRRLA
jgi:hypothetical protein